MRRLFAVIVAVAASAVVLPGAVGASGGAPVSVTFATEVTGSWAAVGNTLYTDPGSWTGQPTATSSQWYRCDADGGNCAAIADNHDFAYTLTPADLGNTLYAVVSATNDSGTGVRASYLTGVVGAPTVLAQPVITGDPNVDTTLSVTTGTWTGTPTSYAYQWSSCSLSTPGDCTPIDGATASTYHVTPSDFNGDYLIADVTAADASGSADNVAHPAFAVGEAHTDVIEPGSPPGPPSAVVLPGWTGDATVAGNVLIGDTGVWQYLPAAKSYGWYRCNLSCVPIAGTEQQLTYTVQADDLGHGIEFAVVASNIAGSSGPLGTQGYVRNNTYRSSSGPAGAPEPGRVPTLVGDNDGVGSVLEISEVTWIAPNDPTVTQTYKWLRCHADGTVCGFIDGATASDYQLTTSDLGHVIYAFVIATNSYGTTTIPTATTTPSIGAPINSDPPVITGDISGAGNTLSASTGEWINSAGTFDYQWYSCDIDGAHCSAIAGATDSTYDVTNGDVGTTVLVEVDATNVEGTGTADSSPTGVVGSPYSTAAPTLGSTDVLQDGTPIAEPGDTLSVGQGTWHGAPTSYTYQWFLCDPSSPTRADFTNCTPIPSATSNHYPIGNDVRGHTIYVEVDATNAFGTAAAYAWPNGSIGAPQPLLDNGSISGTAQVGHTLTFVNGTSWAGETPITWFYRWSRCDTAGANCVTIPGATASTYTLVDADVGHVIQGLIGGRNSWGANGWGLAYNSAVVAATPSSGGSGGGGGTPLDLSVAVAASAAQVAPGGSVQFHVTVTDVSGSAATHLHVTVQIPAGAQVVASSTDRGPGCAVSGSTLDCNLDYLAGSPAQGNVLVTLTFPSAGTQTLTASATADQTDVAPANNSASATVQVGSPPPPPPPPVLPPPLKPPVLKPLSTRTLAGVVRGPTETVTARFNANEPLRLRLTVTKLHQTRRVLLRKGSYLAGLTSKAPAYTLTHAVGRGGAYSIRALFTRSGLTKGAKYVIHMVATNANGTTRTLTMLFRA